jgi:4-amino-4-deoxy-L-arabinose transferase-like glycosyltransferase
MSRARAPRERTALAPLIAATWKWMRRVLGSVPAAAWTCAAVAVLNAACWSLITPPFQVPDEPSHFAYVKQLVENHALPTQRVLEFSSEEELALTDLHEAPFTFMPPTGAISSRTEERKLERDLRQAAGEAREGSLSAGVATSEPPLYYALETIPYLVGFHATLLTRLELMRLLSALFAGITAMFAYLFIREALPGSRDAWVAGGLSVAFAPLLGFVSGAVNPDSLLFAVSAVLFWLLARGFRRGLTPALATAIGFVIAAGLLTKVNFVGLLPGAFLGVAVLALRARPSHRWQAGRLFAISAAIGLGPGVIYAIVNVASGKPTLGFVSSAVSLVHGSVFKALRYTWTLFLPRLPGMKAYVPGLFTTREIWFNGFVGQYAWVETAFPSWAYDVALVFGVGALAAGARALIVVRRAIRARGSELLVYATIALGLIVLIGVSSFYSTSQSYTQTRYLLPLLPLFAAGWGLITRAVSPRWGPVVAVMLVLALVADDIFSQLLVVARFYG